MSAKTAEVRTQLPRMANLAKGYYDETGKICPSALSAVPVLAENIRGRAYFSRSDDWNPAAKNRGQAVVGFGCFGYSNEYAQHFQYEYRATSTGFVLLAHGDLDGDGQLSTFTLAGKIDPLTKVMTLDRIREQNPGE